MKILAIDIGGTEIKYGIVNSSGEIYATKITPTEAEKGSLVLFDKIYKMMEDYLEYNVIGIAISSTGQINGIKGEVTGGFPLIPGWIGTNVVEHLENKYNLPVILENDVNCAALGEFWLGAGKKKEDFLCLTIGTGVGGGIIINNDLYRGSNYSAGEFGCMKLFGDDDFQSHTSMTSLVRMIKNATGKTQNGIEIFDEIHKNNKIYIDIYEKWCESISKGLAILCLIFNPPLIIIGGGVSKQGDFLLNNLKNKLKLQLPKNFTDNLELLPAETGNLAGILGATYLLLKKIGKI